MYLVLLLKKSVSVFFSSLEHVSFHSMFRRSQSYTCFRSLKYTTRTKGGYPSRWEPPPRHYTHTPPGGMGEPPPRHYTHTPPGGMATQQKPGPGGWSSGGAPGEEGEDEPGTQQ